MPEITLGRSDVLRLRKFCQIYGTQWYIAKDQGAYVGASTNAENQCLWYFAGCDPNKDKQSWYSYTRNQFGGDDFGEHLPQDWLDKVQQDPTITRIVIRVSPSSISADFMRK